MRCLPPTPNTSQSIALGKSSTVKYAFKLAAFLAARLFRHPPVIAGLGRYITSAYLGQLVATSSHKADLNSSRGGSLRRAQEAEAPLWHFCRPEGMLYLAPLKSHMLVIRNEQMRAMARKPLADFKDQLAALVVRDFPEQAELLGTGKILDAIHYGVEKALDFGFETSRQLSQYV